MRVQARTLIGYGCIVFGVALLFVQAAVTAQETQIAVTPAIVDAPVVRGESINKSIQITNGNESPLPISIEVQSAIIEGEPLAGIEQSRYDVSDWVTFEQKDYVLAPGEVKRVDFAVTPPFSALPGGHYAQISIRGLTLEQNDDGGTGGLIFPEIGVPLLVTIPGQLIDAARVSPDFGLPAFITPTSDYMLEVPIENTGTVHNIIRPVVTISDGDDDTQYDLRPTVVLPGTVKQAAGTVSFNSYGKHTLQVEVQYGNSKSTSYKELNVYVTPPFTVLFWMAIGLWASMYLLRHRSNMKHALNVIVGR